MSVDTREPTPPVPELWTRAKHDRGVFRDLPIRAIQTQRQLEAGLSHYRPKPPA